MKTLTNLTRSSTDKNSANSDMCSIIFIGNPVRKKKWNKWKSMTLSHILIGFLLRHNSFGLKRGLREDFWESQSKKSSFLEKKKIVSLGISKRWVATLMKSIKGWLRYSITNRLLISLWNNQNALRTSS